MTKYKSSNIIVQFDNSGGNLINMTSYVAASFDLSPSAETIDSTSFGDTWREHLATLNDGGSVTLSGWYDDTATVGPDAIFNAVGSVRSLKITWGSTKTSSVEVVITSYKRTASIGAYTRFEVGLQATGEVAEDA